MQQQALSVPLNALSISARNVRRTAPTRIEELAALIKSQGLLQNLVVVAIEPSKREASAEYEVVGGGRRLRALQLLASQGHIAPDVAIPCFLVDDDQAEEASMAENSGRESMHPADEFDAFKRMHESGCGLEEIAARFGVTPAVVTRRLKLANVSPKLLAVYRAGGMQLEQVMALTITDDHMQQENAWGDNAPAWMRSADSLREKLTRGMVGTRKSLKAAFVGMTDYEAAGGTVIRDLFDDADGGYMTDEALVDRLFAEKLEAEAEKVRAEGWSFVIVRPDVGYLPTYEYGRSKPSNREHTPEEIAELETTTQQLADIAFRIDALGEDEYDANEALEEASERLDAEKTRIESNAQVFTDRQKKKAGAMIGVAHSGLEVERGLIAQTAKKHGAATKDGKPAVKPVHSESLMRRLSAHRTAAMAAHLLEAPRVALDLLCVGLATRLLYENMWPNDGINVRPESQLHALNQLADDLPASRAWRVLHDRFDELRKQMPAEQKDLFAWLGAQPLANVVDILAYCTAVSISAVTGQEKNPPMAELQEALGLDMSSWWQPTQSNYFKFIKKADVLSAVVDAGGKDALPDMEKLKKGQADARAEVLLKDTNWLPTVLRAPVRTKQGPKTNPYAPGSLAHANFDPKSDWNFPEAGA